MDICITVLKDPCQICSDNLPLLIDPNTLPSPKKEDEEKLTSADFPKWS